LSASSTARSLSDIEGECGAAGAPWRIAEPGVLRKRLASIERERGAARVEKRDALGIFHVPLHAERFIEARRAIDVLYAERD
jgi:hypothetical protein